MHDTPAPSQNPVPGTPPAEGTPPATLPLEEKQRIALRVKNMLRAQLEEDKAAFLRDPAHFAATRLPAEFSYGENASPEQRAIGTMAYQTYLATGMEGFAARVLPAAQVAKTHAALMAPDADRDARFGVLRKLRESYGSLGDQAVAELELPEAVNAAIALAHEDPRREVFAAELVNALYTGTLWEKPARLSILKVLAGKDQRALDLVDAFARAAGVPPTAAEGTVPARGPESSPENPLREMVQHLPIDPAAVARSVAALMGQHGALDDSGAYHVAGPAVAGQKYSVTDDILDRAGDLALGVVEMPGSVLHGGINAVNATADLIYDGMDWLHENGWIFDNPIQRLKIPNLPDPRSSGGKMVSSISQFLSGFKGYDKALRQWKAASYGTNTAKNFTTAALADFTVFTGQEERLSNMIQENPVLANPVNEYLAAKPGDGGAEGRLKNALEGLGIGAAAEALFRGMRMMKAGRQMANEAQPDAFVDTAGKQAAMKEREPAVTLTGKEFTSQKGETTKEKATGWYMEHLAGTKGTHPTFGKYTFTTDVGKPLTNSADERKLMLFPKLREIIDSSEEIASVASSKPKHQGKGIEYHYMRTTVRLGDDLLDVGLTMRKASNGKFYYDHLLYDIEAKKNAPWVSPAEVAPISPQRGTLGDHPALSRGVPKTLNATEDNVNLVILGVRSLRGLNEPDGVTKEKKPKKSAE